MLYIVHVPTSSLSIGLSFCFSPISLHRLFSLSSCSGISLVCVDAVVTEPPSPSHMYYYSVLVGTTQESKTLPFSFLNIFLSSTFLHAFSPACILHRTSTSTRLDTFPPQPDVSYFQSKIVTCCWVLITII